MELYSAVFNRIHGTETIGLRYFNIFGPRQSPEGAYAAVIPKFIKNTLNGERDQLFSEMGINLGISLMFPTQWMPIYSH